MSVRSKIRQTSGKGKVEFSPGLVAENSSPGRAGDPGIQTNLSRASRNYFSSSIFLVTVWSSVVIR